jgi:hypothetical protein
LAVPLWFRLRLGSCLEGEVVRSGGLFDFLLHCLWVFAKVAILSTDRFWISIAFAKVREETLPSAAWLDTVVDHLLQVVQRSLRRFVVILFGTLLSLVDEIRKLVD